MFLFLLVSLLVGLFGCEPKSNDEIINNENEQQEQQNEEENDSLELDEQTLNQIRQDYIAYFQSKGEKITRIDDYYVLYGIFDDIVVIRLGSSGWSAIGKVTLGEY